MLSNSVHLTPVEHMPAKHDIDKANKLIITTWGGEASDNELIAAMSRYQQEIRCNSDYQLYDELLDFSHTTKFDLSTKGIKEIGKIAQQSDRPDVQTKVAIIVNSALAFGLSKMYIAYRNLLPNSNKELKAFKNRTDALDWLNHTDDTSNS